MQMSDKEFLEQIEELKQSYAAHLPEKMQQLQSLEKSLDENLTNFEALKELYQLTHKLAGSSASFGFTELSERAYELEMFIKPLVKKSEALDKNSFEVYKTLLNSLKKSFSE